MEKKKVRLGPDAYLICICVFLPVGLLLTGLGTFIGLAVREPMVSWIMVPMGLFFIVLGVSFGIYSLVRRRRLQALLDAGIYFMAQVTDLEADPSVSINGRCPYRLVVEMKDTDGSLHLFKSRSFQLPYIPDLVGQQVRVYADRKDLRHYYVDAEPLLNRVKVH